MPERDSKYVARRAWRRIRTSDLRLDFTAEEIKLLSVYILPFLEELDAAAYSDGYSAGHEDQMRMRIMDAMEARRDR